MPEDRPNLKQFHAGVAGLQCGKAGAEGYGSVKAIETFNVETVGDVEEAPAPLEK